MNDQVIRSDRRFVFAAEPAALWSELERVDAYREWWPWLRSFDAARLAAGETWRCVVKPPLPYVVRFAVTVTALAPGAHVHAIVDGDVTGWARLDIDRRVGGSEVRLVAHLAPRNGMLRTVARVARPAVERGHAWVIDSGAREFGAHVAAMASNGHNRMEP